MYIDHNIFICSFVVEHLGCFPTLAIVLSASVNVGMNLSLLIKILGSGWKFQEVESLDLMEALTFLRILYCWAKEIAQR